MSEFKLEKGYIPFTQVPNNVLTNKDLSLTAKAMYAYLLSKPNNWSFSTTGITKEMKESKTKVTNTLKELKVHGLAKIVQTRGGNGSFTKNVVQVIIPTSDFGEKTIVKAQDTAPPKDTPHHQDVLDAYNSYADTANEIAGATIATKCIKLSDKRKKSINARIAEYNIKDILEMFEEMKCSPFLTGESGGGYNWLNIDWVINPNNMVKILEGKYAPVEKRATVKKTVDLGKHKKAVELVCESYGLEVSTTLVANISRLADVVDTPRRYYEEYLQTDNPVMLSCPSLVKYLKSYMKYLDDNSWISNITDSTFSFEGKIHTMFWKTREQVFGKDVGKVLMSPEALNRKMK